VRELQNVIERGVVLANRPVVRIDDSLLQSEASAGGLRPSIHWKITSAITFCAP
jgi:DNA-binding NtrC family response regulator